MQGPYAVPTYLSYHTLFRLTEYTSQAIITKNRTVSVPLVATKQTTVRSAVVWRHAPLSWAAGLLLAGDGDVSSRPAIGCRAVIRNLIDTWRICHRGHGLIFGSWRWGHIVIWPHLWREREKIKNISWHSRSSRVPDFHVFEGEIPRISRIPKISWGLNSLRVDIGPWRRWWAI